MLENQIDTIVALSSGSLPSGLAVIRVSGPQSRNILKTHVSDNLKPRSAKLLRIKGRNSEIIDEGLVLWFPGPASFTGEDCVEFQVHGGRAVVSALLGSLCEHDQVRLAEAGEFSRRAFENGKLDLTAVDGLSDLIASETEAQRRLALSQSQGALRELYEGWRERLIFIRAMLEAEFDFSDEEDVPEEIASEGLQRVTTLIEEIECHLSDNRAGEIIRDGFRIALMGRPNAGKSSLLNSLARREVAIVTDQAGTTRDVLEVHLDIDGHKVIVSDTAGLRETEDMVEMEGIRRAQDAAAKSDLIVWLHEGPNEEPEFLETNTQILAVQSKLDLKNGEGFGVSVKTGEGIDELIQKISEEVFNRIDVAGSGLITRQRYRNGLVRVLEYLRNVASASGSQLELRAEDARLAGVELGRLTGKVDVEDLLDVIFSEFCVGK